MPEIDLTDIKGHMPKLGGFDVTHQLTLWTIMDETSLGAVENLEPWSFIGNHSDRLGSYRQFPHGCVEKNRCLRDA
jgi:hypothetical protein